MKITKKHPLLLRWNHWINFPVLFVMIWSGLMIYWANPAYLIRGDWLKAIGLNSRLGEGMAWHFTFALLFLTNGLLYTIFLLATGHWRYLLPSASSIRDAYRVVLHDLHLTKAPLPPQVKYNGAQKFAYTGTYLLGVGAALTGLAIYKPVQLGWLLSLLGGYSIARMLHFSITILFVLFFFIHIVQVILAGWNNFRSMVTGWEERRNDKT